MTVKRLLFLYAETPIHAGTGAGLGAVDMPIQRERANQFPIIQGSGVKGALRSNMPDDDDVNIVFGPPAKGNNGDTSSDYGGAISVSDARTLLFPVRALRGVFVWVTCTDALARFARDAALAPVPVLEDTPIGIARVSNNGLLLDNKILLEEFSFEAAVDDDTQWWAGSIANYAFPKEGYDYWRNRLRNHLVILSNDDFRDFVLYSTEIVTRIRIDSARKTVEKGALFTQELLPADTLMYSLVTAHIPRKKKDELENTSFAKPDNTAEKVMNWLQDGRNWLQGGYPNIQIGGDETIGRGFVRLNWGGQQ